MKPKDIAQALADHLFVHGTYEVAAVSEYPQDNTSVAGRFFARTEVLGKLQVLGAPDLQTEMIAVLAESRPKKGRVRTGAWASRPEETQDDFVRRVCSQIRREFAFGVPKGTL